VISYHCNSAAIVNSVEGAIEHCTKNNINGHETFYAKGSPKGLSLANALNNATRSALGNATRQHIAIDNINRDGAGLILRTPQVTCLHELAFIPNIRETDNLLAKWADLVEAHARVIFDIQINGIDSTPKPIA
jgi:hypothetical protein